MSRWRQPTVAHCLTEAESFLFFSSLFPRRGVPSPMAGPPAGWLLVEEPKNASFIFCCLGIIYFVPPPPGGNPPAAEVGRFLPPPPVVAGGFGGGDGSGGFG